LGRFIEEVPKKTGLLLWLLLLTLLLLLLLLLTLLLLGVTEQ
jgi:hypothetical protein